MIVCFLLSSCAHLRCDACQHHEVLVDSFPPLPVLHKPASSANRHIYLEGDGMPWVEGMIRHPDTGDWVIGQKPADNPTSQNKLALQLMALDANDAIYLERPCYGLHKKHGLDKKHGLGKKDGLDKQKTAPCDARWWTHDRYHDHVVMALDQAISRLQADLGHKPLILIGHSGGGALAMLVAQRRSDVKGVVTLAGNLDHRAWTQHHGYLPLSGSLNVSDQEILPENVFRWHFLARDDQVIPPAIVQAVLTKDGLAKVHTVDAGHQKNWQTHWPDILNLLNDPL